MSQSPKKKKEKKDPSFACIPHLSLIMQSEQIASSIYILESRYAERLYRHPAVYRNSSIGCPALFRFLNHFFIVYVLYSSLSLEDMTGSVGLFFCWGGRRNKVQTNYNTRVHYIIYTTLLNPKSLLPSLLAGCQIPPDRSLSLHPPLPHRLDGWGGGGGV